MPGRGGQHRLPVGDRGAHLAEQLPQPSGQSLGLVSGHATDMDMDDAQPVMAEIALGKAAIAEDFIDAALAVPDDDDRMGDQQRLAGALGDLAKDRIEQERHVVVDDGDDRQRPALAHDLGLDVYGDTQSPFLCLATARPARSAARSRSAAS
ncbi:hypothetical protein AJ88_21335 [Mesorhizobium amorphae CCBAU 01583]|nr:hypothetical protein AJ88_21335 [Mesorhizobium amorphae CCBAU 01583]